MENQSVGSPLTGRFAVWCALQRDGKTTETTVYYRGQQRLVGIGREWVIGTVHGFKICATSHQIPVLEVLIPQCGDIRMQGPGDKGFWI